MRQRTNNRGKLFPDRYLHPIPACSFLLRLLLPVALVVSRYPVCSIVSLLSSKVGDGQVSVDNKHQSPSHTYSSIPRDKVAADIR